jgi:hypothetical protein
LAEKKIHRQRVFRYATWHWVAFMAGCMARYPSVGAAKKFPCREPGSAGHVESYPVVFAFFLLLENSKW